MKQFLLTIALLFCWCVSYGQSEPTLPRGLMTYNEWSGHISVGGETIPKDLERYYFGDEDYSDFKMGRTMNYISLVPAVLGGAVFGCGLGYTIGLGEFDEYSMGYLLGGGVVAAAGVVVSVLGNKKIRKAVSNYNTSTFFVHEPTVSFGPTKNGVGLSVMF